MALTFLYGDSSNMSTGKVPYNGGNHPVPYYAQGNAGGGSAWAAVPFGGKDIANSGCSITSFAMTATYLLGKKITPDMVLKKILDTYGDYNKFYVPDSGQGWDIFPALGQLYGLNCLKLDNSGLVASVLLGDAVVIQSCKKGYFTSGGHFIVLTGISSSMGSIVVNDPNGNHISYSFQNIGSSKILSEGKGWWAFSGGGTHSTASGNAQPWNIGGGAVSESASNGTAGTSVDTSSGGGILSALGGIGSALADAFSDIGSFFDKLKFDVSDITSGLSSLHFANYSYKINYETVTTEIERDEIKTADFDSPSMGGASSLLSYPSLVESPYVQLEVGGVIFGKYRKDGLTKEYPNYIQSMTIEKINGQLNQYTINLIYQIDNYSDPNYIDKVLSSNGINTVSISYGDYSNPGFCYKEEKALLTKVSSQIDFGNSRINYTIHCTSTASLLAATTNDFPAQTAKPSSIILSMLSDNRYGLLDVFPGMRNRTSITRHNLIATDDQAVEIEAKNGMDSLTYLQYLVTCMSASTNGSSDPIKDSTYHMTIYDDNVSDLDLDGCYFKILKVSSSTKALALANTYEVDIGYPSDNQVLNFSISTDNSWSILYNYSDTINQPYYTYGIDNDGRLTTEYSPNIMTSTAKNKMTETQKTWWTNMTQFPINASLTIKGLARPALLMTYLRVNAIFYGQKHISSGLYIITGQTDLIDGAGYRTTLALTRIAGDNDYIQKTKVNVTSIIPTSIEVTKTEENVQVQSSGLYDANMIDAGLASDMFGGAGTDGGLGTAPNSSMYSVDNVAASPWSSSAWTPTGTFAAKAYNVDSLTACKIAAAMATELGYGDSEDTITALKWEVTLLCNLYEKYQSLMPGASLMDFIFAGKDNADNRAKSGMAKNWTSSWPRFFATAAANAYTNCPGPNVSFTFYRSGKANPGAVVTTKMVQATKEVLGGKRYHSADEQGCDFGYLECNGQVINGREAYQSAKKNKPELFIPGKTILLVVWSDGSKGAKSTFLGFPANNPKFDAFCKRL